MANLHFISNVMHNGILFPGRKIENNRVVSDGAVVDLSADTRGLASVAGSLVERGLAEYTNSPATHTSVLVNAAQEAIPVDAPAGTGSAPVADQIKAREALQRNKQPENQAPAAPATQPQAPAQPKQPTPEEVAATAAAA